MCSALVGSDFSGGYLSESRKLDMTHAAYKSVATHIQDLAGGLVSWGLGTIAAAQGALKDHLVRPIAVFGTRPE